MDRALARRLEACQTLPTLPAVALELVELCQREEIDLLRISQALSRDQALVARLLRIANSASFAARGRITTVSRAVALLGTNSVLILALSFTLVQMRRASGAARFDHGAHWRRSLLCATAARVLAEREGLDPEELFLGGLLQDIGMLALFELAPEDYGMLVRQSAGDHARLAVLEREHFGADHAEVSALLARRWNLPRLIEATAAGSHDPLRTAPAESALAQAVRCVHRSGVLADLWVPGAVASGDALEDARTRLGFEPGELSEVLTSLATRIPEVARDFEVHLGDPDEADRVLSLARERLVEVGLRAATSAREATMAVRNLATENRTLEERSAHDSLTGVFSRAHLDAELPVVFEAARARGLPLTLAMCDIVVVFDGELAQLAAADSSLYRAKQGGRNRVVVHGK